MLLIPSGPSCTSSGERTPGRESAGSGALEDKGLADEHAATLVRLERLFYRKDPGYEAERDRLLGEEPRLGPWLAKAMVGHAVRQHERMMRKGLVLDWVEQAAAESDHLLFRVRAELAYLDAAGRAAIVRYLLHNPRARNRDLGVFLLHAHPPEAVIDVLEKECAERRLGAKAIELLGRLQENDRAIVLLERLAKSRDWQVRGQAIRVLGDCYRERSRPDAARVFWAVFRNDDDGWVRRQALLALGELGDVGQTRPLVDQLEILVRDGRTREADAAAESLRRLTGLGYGRKVRMWRTWLGGEGRADRQ